jgi:hypothetical protein
MAHRDEPEDKRETPVGLQAETIVDAILADMSDRRGLRQEWDGIDADIQGQIRAEWINIARRVIERG